MQPNEFKAARRKLGLTLAELGHVLDTDPRTIRRWETDATNATARSVNPIAALAMGWFLAGFRPDNWPPEKR